LLELEYISAFLLINSALWINIVERCGNEILQTFLVNALGYYPKKEEQKLLQLRL